jgi:formylglycine-generating enzyme required for sulfatase activity
MHKREYYYRNPQTERLGSVDKLSLPQVLDSVISIDERISDSQIGFELTRILHRQGIGAVVSKFENNNAIYYLIEYNGERNIFSTRNKYLLSISSFQNLYGKKYLIPLITNLEFVRTLWEKESFPVSPSPVLIIGQFERIGSTWLMDFMDKIGRGQTEPLRQHVGTESPISTWSQIVENADTHTFHSELKKSGFAQIWISNFLASQYQPETQITKETNLFFTLGFYLDLFPKESNILYLKKDVRGILSSFKRGKLYDKWNYFDRYLLLKRALIVNRKTEYLSLISHVDEDNWIDVLLFLYVANLIQIQKHLFIAKGGRDILELSYEDMVVNKSAELDRVQAFLGSNIEVEDEVNEVDNNNLFNTSKKKDNPFDWEDVLTKEEEEYIRTKMSELINLVNGLFSNEVAQFVETESFAPAAPDFASGKEEYCSHTFEVQLLEAHLSREQIHNAQAYVEIPSGSVLTLPDGHRQLSAKNEYVPDFKFSERLTTNLEFASFLNWLHQHGFQNSIQGHYIYYNPNIPPTRGGRIVFKNGEYLIEKSYEDHPANWVSWIGAKAYAMWLGARLPMEKEWDRVADLSDFEFTNFDHNNSNTTEVRQYVSNNLGIFDMFGNLRNWTENWYYPDKINAETGISKVVKGLAWNAPGSTARERTYKPVFMSARSIGIRLVKATESDDRSEMSEVDLITKYTTLHSLLMSGIACGESVFDVNRKLDKILSIDGKKT